MTRWNRDPYLMRVLRAFGNASALAEFVGLTKQGVSAWTKVPKQHIRAISEKTGIHPYRIRPDIYVEGLWDMGLNTAEIAEKMKFDEPEICHLLAEVLEKRRNRVHDVTYPTLSAVREPPVEGN